MRISDWSSDVCSSDLTLDRSEGGVDSAFSLEPAELAELVEAARIARVAVGIPTFTPTASEGTVLKNRRSLYIVAPVAKGEELTTENVRSIRPGNGMKPKYLEVVFGKRAASHPDFGEPLQSSNIEGGRD